MSYEPIVRPDGGAAFVPDAPVASDAQAALDAAPFDGGFDAGATCEGCPTVAVAAGRDHTCALASSGEVHCWGRNGDRQLGTGSTADHDAVPAAVRGLTDATAIAAGEWHTCAIREGGSVACWGDNSLGQVGDGSATDAADPVAVPMVSGAIGISAGHGHTCAVVSTGDVVCWGDNARGQLGASPAALLRGTVVLTDIDAVSLAAGGEHTCALEGSGAVSCWGANESGQLGDGTMVDRHTPSPIAAAGGPTVAVSAGGAHSCAVLTTGSARCWGSNASGQLGDGTVSDRSTATAVVGITDALRIAAGDGHTCAAIVGGVRCWGRNEGGELGDGTGVTSWTPVATSGIEVAVVIEVDWFHSVALLGDGSIVGWGDNRWGQIGDGTLTNRLTPVAVSLP